MPVAAAKKAKTVSVHQEIGLVTRATPTAIVVRLYGHDVEATRATSCLVAPAQGDEVLVALASDGRAFVLAVLVRKEAEAPVSIAVEADLELSSSKGKVRVTGAEGVGLTSGRLLSIVTGELDVRTVAATLVTSGMELLGKTANVEVDKIQVAATTMDTVLERWSQKLKRAYRFIEEREQLRAGALDYRAKEAVTITAENAVVTAKEIVKVDGGQIQLG